jgi:Transglutaminase-like superfamily
MYRNSSPKWKGKVCCVWNELQRYRRLPRSRKRLLREALIALALARGAMACLPFRRIAAWLGTPGTETPPTAAPGQIHLADRIGWAVGTVARRVPWDARCLAQALAATWMLRRRGLEGTVSFGADRGESRQFLAHAWLRFGPRLVTGGPGRERFKTLTTFARKQA